MAIKFVRQPSETPNIMNVDDIVPFRYAYGNQNGYVKDKGNQLSYTVNGSNFKINSGRVVLFGVESDIDANGVTITVPSVGTTRYYSVYYHVNLGTNTTSIESTFSTTDYPTISTGDDLTANTSGSANLELYRFTALNGVISNVTKIVKEIVYPDGALNGYDATKGTIETRLTNLGFKQDTVNKDGFNSGVQSLLNSGSITFNRQGNYVWGAIQLSFSTATNMLEFLRLQMDLCTIPENFRPKYRSQFFITYGARFRVPSGGTSYQSIYTTLSSACIAYNDKITLRALANNMVGSSIAIEGFYSDSQWQPQICFGWEANPIT